MSSVEGGTATREDVGLSGREARVIGGAAALLAINVAVMYAVAGTPLSAVNDSLFSVPIVGVLVYGAAITGGELIAERGIEDGDAGIAFVGAVVLQVAFGVFGAGVLRFVPPDRRPTVLAATAVVVAAITAAIATYVYARSKTFERWGTYATYSFLGGIVAVAVGTLYEPALLVGFVLIFLGFLLRLGWEIRRVRDRRDAGVALQTIGVYVAVAGVFVHVLQLAVRALARR